MTPPYGLELQVFTSWYIDLINKISLLIIKLKSILSFQTGFRKNGGEIKLTVQLKITTPESDKWKLVLKAFYVTSISSIQISSASQ